MPKVERVPFSKQNLSISEAAAHHIDSESALRVYYSAASPTFGVRFAGYKLDEVRSELDWRLAELDRNTTVTMLAAVEAAFRVDYLLRSYEKKKDPVSREFYRIYQEMQTHVSLEDEIFGVWKNNTTGSSKLIGDLRGAFKFRHWMAHGRYWTPKLGKNFDFLSVYPLALQAVSDFPLLKP